MVRVKPYHSNEPFPPGYRMQSEDGEPWVERALIAEWQRVSPTEKLAMVAAATRALHELHLRGLQLQYPEADSEELELRAACRRLGRELVSRVVGEEEIPPGC